MNDDRFRQLFSAIDEGYCLCEIILDGDSHPVDYRFLETNPLFEEMTGLTDAVGRTARELVPGLEPHWPETYARAAIGGERIRFEQAAESIGRWFNCFAMPMSPHGHFAAVFKDETARRKAEVALRQSEDRYRFLAEEEHRIAVRLQRALLPDNLLQHPGVEIAAHYHADDAMLQVGGDWYDTFSWPDGRIGIMVGDVVGHDLDAAASMGHLRAAVAALAPPTDGSPAAMLMALDRCARGPNGSDFVTASCIVIDPDSGVMTFASAGHPPILIVSDDGRSTWANHATAPPLGMLPRDPPHEASVVLQPNSTVVLYTDGLVERRCESIDAGFARLEAATVNLLCRGTTDLGAELVVEMARHSAPSDDVVVVTVRFAPVAPR
jgi:serine phosphatase RsbU (regulator of sigma subunit)